MEIEKVKQANKETQPNVKMSMIKLLKVNSSFLSYGKVSLVRALAPRKTVDFIGK